MILVIDLCYKKDSLSFSEFVLPVLNVASKNEKCWARHYSEVNEECMKRYKKVILCGTGLFDNGFQKYCKKLSFLCKTDLPIMGICAGMQAIGILFNSKIEKVQEIGMAKIKKTRKNMLFDKDFEAYELHNFAVVPSREFESIAKSKKCVQAIKHRKKEIYGVMFHPEVRNNEILERFLRI